MSVCDVICNIWRRHSHGRKILIVLKNDGKLVVYNVTGSLKIGSLQNLGWAQWAGLWAGLNFDLVLE